MARGRKLPTSLPGFGHLERRPGTANWYLVYRPEPNAKRIVRSARTSDQESAFNALVKLKADFATGKRLGVSAETATFADLFALLRADYHRKERATDQELSQVVAKHLEPVFGKRRVLDLRKTHVEAFIADRRKELEPASVNKLLSHLRRAMKLGTKEDPPLVLRIPDWFEKLDENNQRTGVIDPDTYRVLRDELAPHARLAFVIGYHTGLRRGAILNLLWSWVDWRERVIRIPQSEDAETKKKPRIVPIYGDMRAYMEMAFLTGKSDYVVELDGKPVNSIKTAWNAACRRAKVTGTLFHDLRRTAATMLHEAGYDIGVIMDVCGWKSVEMPKRYIQQSVRQAQNVGATMEAFIERRAAKQDETVKSRPM